MNDLAEVDNSTLKEGEFHPVAHTAFAWWHAQIVKDPIRYAMLREAIASTALSGNRLAEICMGTIERLDHNKPISDRYLLGLCWFMRDMIERVQQEGKTNPVEEKK